jgi:glycosyltransferase involved in cell wall biosynthesis
VTEGRAPATVAINLLWLVPGDVGGSESSTLSSLRGLVELAPPDLDLRLLVLEPFVAAHPDVAAALPTEVLPLSGRSRVARVVGEATWLARRTRGVDLVHHAGGTAPRRARVPYVLTLHDLQPLERDATHSAAKRAYLAHVVPPSLRGARRIVVPSAFVRTSVVARRDVDPERVVVVPHGVARHPAPTPAAPLAERHRLDGPVVLYPAITYPHKDHATLIRAFARVAAHHTDALLVLTGRPDRSEAEVLALVDQLGLADRVRRLDRLPDEDIAGLYELASVVAVPSTYEGFGLPAVEAMAYGTPVVAADATALSEVVGDAGILVAPGAVEAWAAALDRLLGDAGERARLAAAGRARAERYSPRANAEALAEVYRGSAHM